jgi:hypothetical protein
MKKQPKVNGREFLEKFLPAGPCGASGMLWNMWRHASLLAAEKMRDKVAMGQAPTIAEAEELVELVSQIPSVEV